MNKNDLNKDVPYRRPQRLYKGTEINKRKFRLTINRALGIVTVWLCNANKIINSFPEDLIEEVDYVNSYLAYKLEKIHFNQ